MEKGNREFQLGYRAEIDENTLVDNAPVIRSHPTCLQCKKLQAEIKRLKNIVAEHNLGPVIMKPRNWRDTWAETPDKVSPKQGISFVARHSYNSSQEEERMRKEIERLQYELNIRAAEVQRLRGRTTEATVPQRSRGYEVKSRERGETRAGTVRVPEGEGYNALYLQEWKTAYTSLSAANVKGEEIIDQLLSLLKVTYSNCLALATSQLNSIVESTIIKNPRETAETLQRERDEARADAKRYQREVAAQLTLSIQRSLYPKIYSSLPQRSEARKDTKVHTYINKCIEVCWQMCIQDDTIALDSNVYRFSSFNTESYRYFGDQGQFVDYVVWPPAVAQSGKLVARGVAEATSRSE